MYRTSARLPAHSAKQYVAKNLADRRRILLNGRTTNGEHVGATTPSQATLALARLHMPFVSPINDVPSWMEREHARRSFQLSRALRTTLMDKRIAPDMDDSCLNSARVFCNWNPSNCNTRPLLHPDAPHTVRRIAVVIPEYLSLCIDVSLDVSREEWWCMRENAMKMFASVTHFSTDVRLFDGDRSSTAKDKCESAEQLLRSVSCFCLDNIGRHVFDSSALALFLYRRMPAMLVHIMDDLYTRMHMETPADWHEQRANAKDWVNPSPALLSDLQMDIRHKLHNNDTNRASERTNNDDDTDALAPYTLDCDQYNSYYTRYLYRLLPHRLLVDFSQRQEFDRTAPVFTSGSVLDLFDDQLTELFDN